MATPVPVVSLTALLRGGGPRFVRDAAGPVVVFYVGWKVSGLLAGIAAATLLTTGAFLWERRRARTGLGAALGLGIAFVQALAGLFTGSPTAYLAPGLIANAVYGLVFLGSVAVGRPLVAVLAREAYPFPDEVRSSAAFHRLVGRVTLVWGACLLGRSVLRLVVLATAALDVYVAVNVLTGGPVTGGLFTWSVWYAVRSLRGDTGTGLAARPRDRTAPGR